MTTHNRLSSEIVEEMRTTYEMPAEAIEWISEMISYTVAGGKMNRGLSCVSVMRTLAADQGRAFTDSVSELTWQYWSLIVDC
jgi:hypothetical protein